MNEKLTRSLTSLSGLASLFSDKTHAQAQAHAELAPVSLSVSLPETTVVETNSPREIPKKQVDTEAAFRLRAEDVPNAEGLPHTAVTQSDTIADESPRASQPPSPMPCSPCASVEPSWRRYRSIMRPVISARPPAAIILP